MSLGNTVLQPFCCFYLWCLYRYFQFWIYSTFTLALSVVCVHYYYYYYYYKDCAFSKLSHKVWELQRNSWSLNLAPAVLFLTTLFRKSHCAARKIWCMYSAIATHTVILHGDPAGRAGAWFQASAAKWMRSAPFWDFKRRRKVIHFSWISSWVRNCRYTLRHMPRECRYGHAECLQNVQI